MATVEEPAVPVLEESKGEDGSSSSEESEEEVEPKLKYERIANDLRQILKKDAVSCIAVHAKFLALGTHFGMIHIMDHQGNNIKSKELLLHTTTVNQISMDENGDYIASCSNDGKVVVRGLFTSDLYQVLSFDRPVRSVYLDPNFHKPGSGKRFITGDDKVTLYEKMVFNRYKSTVLHHGAGAVYSICWKDCFVAWASDTSVRVFDMETRKTIALIKRDHDQNLRSELYRCNICWKDENTLLIGWADTVKVCVVQERSVVESAAKALPDRYIEIVSMFTTDFYVCGIAPLGNTLAVLSVFKETELQPESSRPQLRVLETQREDYSEISSDLLSLRGYARNQCKDYYLDCLPEEGLFFLVSPKDVVVAKPRDEDDHIAWLLEHGLYEEALKTAVNCKELKRHSVLDVGRTYLNRLLQQRMYNEAAQLCVTILGDNRSRWEEEVYKFAEIQQLRAIAPYLPWETITLDPAIYEMVLNEFILTDAKGFLKLIRQWPPSLYSLPVVEFAVIDRLTFDPSNRDLLQSLGELYTYEKKYDKALTISMKIGNKDHVFKLIREHSLFGAIHDKLETLMDLNSEEATQMLVDNIDKVPIEVVVPRLKKKSYFLYLYLDRVFLKDPDLGEEHHGLLVELYAEYAPDRLLSFLRKSNNYPLEQALSICQQRRLIPETVFLLGRMGNTKQALQQIMKELGDIDKAIEFCKEHDDKDLWEDLIKYSLDKPHFITVLLHNIGTHVDPIILIQRIKTGMEIPGLRDSLVKILHDFNLQISLREGCKKILVSDCFGLQERRHRLQKRGMAVPEDQLCQACQRKLFVTDSRYAENIVIFYCKHAFHEDCLPSQEQCTSCSAQKRRPRMASDFRR